MHMAQISLSASDTRIQLLMLREYQWEATVSFLPSSKEMGAFCISPAMGFPVEKELCFGDIGLSDPEMLCERTEQEYQHDCRNKVMGEGYHF